MKDLKIKRTIVSLLLFAVALLNAFSFQPRYKYRYNDTPFVLLVDSLIIKNAKISVNLATANTADYSLNYRIEMTNDQDSLLFSIAYDASNLKISLDGHVLNTDSLSNVTVNFDSIPQYRVLANTESPYLFILDRGIHQLDVSFALPTNIIRGDVMYTYYTRFDFDHLRKARSLESMEVKIASAIADDDIKYSIGGLSYKLEQSKTLIYNKVPDYDLGVSYSPKPIFPVIPQEIVSVLIIFLLLGLGIYFVVKKMDREKGKKRFKSLISISLLTPFVWFLLYYAITYLVGLFLGQQSCYFEIPDIYYYIFYVFMYPVYVIITFIILFIIDLCLRSSSKKKL